MLELIGTLLAILRCADDLLLRAVGLCRLWICGCRDGDSDGHGGMLEPTKRPAMSDR